MPHLIIESSIPLSSSVVEELHKVVGQQKTISIASVKTRLYSTSISFSGDQRNKEHTAITLKLLPGRSLILKEQMASCLFDRASELIQKGTVSVEIVDLGIYRK